MRVISLNVAVVRHVAIRGKQVATGIFKQPVEGPCQISAEGIVGDAVVDARRGGRAEQALCLYPQEHYDSWHQELQRADFIPGFFGENLTTRGLLETEVCIGDRFQLGTAEVQVSGPRIPCRKLKWRVGRGFTRLFLQSGRVGFYFRVLKEGQVEAGSTFQLLSRRPRSPSVATFTRVLFVDYWDAAGLSRLLEADSLAEDWKQLIRTKLARCAQAPYWVGTRPLKITAQKQESALLQSYELACQYGQPLPAFEPGHSLPVVFRESQADSNYTTRPYALCARLQTQGHYRILTRSGQRPAFVSGGDLSSFADTGWQKGTLLRVSAPAGNFILPRSARALVWLSEGLGLAPISAMLAALGQTKVAQLDATLIHSDMNSLTQPFGSELSSLCQKAGAVLRVFYRAAAPPDVLGGNYYANGWASIEDAPEFSRWSAEAHFMLAGSETFTIGVRATLERHGVPDERIQCQAFGKGNERPRAPSVTGER